MSKGHFIETIRRITGGAPDYESVIPGKMIRFATSDRRGDTSGWCRLFEDGEGGVFGCWRQGISEDWQARPARNADEQKSFLARVHQAKAETARMEAEYRKGSREKSADLWDRAGEADLKHPYLATKRIRPIGIRQLRDSLLIPVRDVNGTLHGLQFIMPDGTKRFKSGTAVAGCYHGIGRAEGTILVAEGYATGATLHEITGHAVACAFSASNLKPATEALRRKYPDKTLIICADDDHLTEGNPGLTMAAETARAAGGLLAIPCFPAMRKDGDTDFNDLAILAGREAVEACIAAAAAPDQAVQGRPAEPVSIDAVILRLAKLSPLQYDLVRRQEARSLGVRPVTLDAAVRDARKGSAAEDLPFTETEPWPEPVAPEILLNDIAATIRRFIVCDRDTAHAVTLWAAMTWFIDHVQVAPLAVITAPEKRCGKSQLLFLLGRLSARAITTSSISPAALFRTIDSWCPTLLIDEADAFMRDNEELRGIINSGHTRESAYVIRTVGENFTPTRFNTWGAKAIAGIGQMADTIMDRAVLLQLRRKLPHEEVERIRHAEPGLFDDLRSRLARFAEDCGEQVRQARPPLPDCLNDRAQHNWEPLLAIAMTAGSEWLEYGTMAALKLSGTDNTSQTVGTELLADIREIFGADRDRITTAEMIRLLCSDEERPWSTFSRGNAITPRQLAKRLKEYGIYSHTIRIGIETAKGYMIDQFRDVFSRYLPPPGELSVTTSQLSSHAASAVTDVPSRFQGDLHYVTRRPASGAGCDAVTDTCSETEAVFREEYAAGRNCREFIPHDATGADAWF